METFVAVLAALLVYRLLMVLGHAVIVSLPARRAWRMATRFGLDVR